MTDDPRPEAGLDLRVAKALSHPLRQRLLMGYDQAECSPSELATRLDEPLNEVAYHTKRLLEMGLITLVRTKRGPGIKHFYRAVARAEATESEWIQMPRALRLRLSTDTMRQVVDEAGTAASTGALEAPDVHFSRVPIDLDEQAWQELADLLEHVVERATQLSQESAARRAPAPGERPSVLGIFHFPRE